jgi:hypothetical protein
VTGPEQPEPDHRESKDAMNTTIRSRGVAIVAAVLTGAAVLAGAAITDAKGDSEAAARFATERAELVADHRLELERQDDAATALRRKVIREARAAQRRHDKRVLRRALRKTRSNARRAAESARSEGYANGSSAGYSNGSREGFRDGLVEGSDSLTCSDDPDVTWLPFCY